MIRGTIKRLAGHPWVLRRLDAANRPRIVVLMYHDLRDDDDFCNWLRVPATEFDRQLTMLRSLGEFVSPDQAADPAALPVDRLHFLLTFDDGYVNNHRLALPILARHRAPALFFVSTGPLVERRPFWPDIVVTPIQVLGLESVDLTAEGLGVFRFRNGDQAARWDGIERLLVALKTTGDEDHPIVAACLQRFRDDYRTTLAEHLPRFAPLDERRLRDMARDPWCSLGSHGHRHRLLTRHPGDDLAHALGESRRLLEDLGDAPVTSLAYPNGDHDRRVRDAASAAGYLRAYTTTAGMLDAGTAPLAIPRVGVSGTDPAWLLRFQLARVLLGNRRPTVEPEPDQVS